MAKNEQDSNKTSNGGVLGFFRIVESLSSSIGFPGVFVVLVWYSIHSWATAEQKAAIVDRYILGRGLSDSAITIVLALVFFVTVFALRRSHNRNMGELEEELERCGNEKSLLQETLARRDLQHTELKKKRRH